MLSFLNIVQNMWNNKYSNDGLWLNFFYHYPIIFGLRMFGINNDFPVISSNWLVYWMISARFSPEDRHKRLWEKSWVGKKDNTRAPKKKNAKWHKWNRRHQKNIRWCNIKQNYKRVGTLNWKIHVLKRYCHFIWKLSRTLVF